MPQALEKMGILDYKRMTSEAASVIRQFSFQGFLNAENWKKLEKKTEKVPETWELGNLPAGLAKLSLVKSTPDLTLYQL